MTFNPQNFVDGKGPALVAAWLNALDVTVNEVLGGAQTLPALQAIIGSGAPVNQAYFGLDSGGAANTYVVATSSVTSPPTTLAAGLLVKFLPNETNTGASTFNFCGLGQTAIVSPLGVSLSGGELTNTVFTVLMYTGSLWQIVIANTPTLVAELYTPGTTTGYQVVTTLPITGLYVGRTVYDSTNNTLYTYNGTAWVSTIPAGLITGQLTAAQIASITAAQLTGQITTTQISNSAITTPLLAAGAVNSAAIAAGTIVAANIAAGAITSALIAAGAVTATQIAANTITAGQIAAGTITGTQIAASTITASLISVSSLSALSANIGTVTAGLLQNAAGTSYLSLTNSQLVFNNGTNMLVRGLGFGAASNYLEWFGPTQSSASNFVACTDALAIYYLKTDGTYRFGAVQQAPATTTLTGPLTTTYTIPANKTLLTIELFADSGAGGVGNNTIPTSGGGGGSGGYAKSIYNIAAGGGLTLNLNLQQGASNPTASTVSSGTFTITTMSVVGGTSGANGTSSNNGTPGTGGTATGGNVFNASGNDGNLYNTAGYSASPGQALFGTYGNGPRGGRGLVGTGTANPGLPAVCYLTAT